MPATLKGRSVLTLREFSESELNHLLDVADEAKRLKRSGVFPRRLEHKNVALLFLKPSLRTRMSFVVAAADEGAHLEFFSAEDIRFGIKESIRDVATVTGRLFDGIAFRGYGHEGVVELARHAGVPVWNALCDTYHPTQGLADMMTMREEFGSLKGLPVAYIGDGRNNQANTLIICAAKLGLNLRIVAPEQLFPAKELTSTLMQDAHPAAKLEVTSDVKRGIEGAQVVYNDVWVSMGEDALIAERARQLAGYKVTAETFALTKRPDAIYLHCLPALHDMETEFGRKHPNLHEVEDAVFYGRQSRAFELAENRMHAIKAVMVATI
jgi:ornithine carbamoyltransferase